MIKLVSKLQSSWRRQMQTIFWQRESIWCLNLKHKSQRHWAEINITVLIVISRMVVLITACMRQESPSYTEHFSVPLSTPHTLSSCLSRHISECSQSRLFRSKHNLRLCCQSLSVVMVRWECVTSLSLTYSYTTVSQSIPIFNFLIILI